MDPWCGIHELIGSITCSGSVDFSDQATQVIEDGIYIFGRTLFYKNFNYIQELIETKRIKVVYSHPFEGSSTLGLDLLETGIDAIAKQKKFLIIAGAELGHEYACLAHETLLIEIYNVPGNKQQCARVNEIYNKTNKPYKFLFLNGMYRWHRKYLIERFKDNNLLDQSLWSCLDCHTADIHLLDKKYELPEYQSNLDANDLAGKMNYLKRKRHLFNDNWGDGQLVAEPYIDTYFSLVTETVTDSYSFRTEKIWKPIAIGHPWIAVANAGFYKDIRNLGFKTFEHLIDESFDLIEDSQQRVSRIAEVVEDLCKSDLDQFLKESHDICTYNQQHFADTAIKIQQEFPERFLDFLNQNIQC
jgi:hypothetical protein